MSILDNEFATIPELRAEVKVLRDRVKQLEEEAELKEKLKAIEIGCLKSQHASELADLSSELHSMADMIKKMIAIAGDEMWWQKGEKHSPEFEKFEANGHSYQYKINSASDEVESINDYEHMGKVEYLGI